MKTDKQCTCKGARTLTFDKSTHELTCTGCSKQVVREDDTDDLPF
jgi:ribosomal protein S27E